MTKFSDLPNELIMEVWRWIQDAEAVEAFALTSKRIHAQGSAFIEEHNELRAKFWSVACEKSEMDDRVELLRILLLNPRATCYVRRLLIDERRYDFDRPIRLDLKSADTMEHLRQWVLHCSFISKDDIDSCLKELAKGRIALVESLILISLPNVHSITLHHTYKSMAIRLFYAIRHISRLQDTGALSRLTEVRLRPVAWSNSGKYDWVCMFASLPSVRKIESWDLEHDDDVSVFDWCDCDYVSHSSDDDSDAACHDEHTHDCDKEGCKERKLSLRPKSSAVTHVALLKCSINPTRFCHFLKGLRALESFKYDSARIPFDCSEPLELVNALRVHNRHSLRSLLLRSKKSWFKSPGLTFAKLEVLKKLDTDYDLVFGDNGESILAAMLPRSIEKVSLNAFYSSAKVAVERHVLDMTVDKEQCLPNLKELTIYAFSTEESLISEKISQLKQRCEEVGVCLNVTTGAGSLEDDYRRR